MVDKPSIDKSIDKDTVFQHDLADESLGVAQAVNNDGKVNILPNRFTGELSDVIYHYCSPETLLKILSARSFRFSDLSQLNDAEERVWGYKNVFLECLKRIREGRGVPVGFPQVEEDKLVALDREYQRAELHSQPFVCCFSTDGDSLSQWRAYARDGAGYAIGVSRDQFKHIPTQLLTVEYDAENQLAEMFDALSFILLRHSLDDIREPSSLFISDILLLSSRAVAYKNPAFRDEKEIRAVWVVAVGPQDAERSFHPTGGRVKQQPVPSKCVEFEARGDRIVPYVDWCAVDEDDRIEIDSVHLGPKNKNKVDDVRLMLNTIGLSGIDIRQAGAAYR